MKILLNLPKTCKNFKRRMGEGLINKLNISTAALSDMNSFIFNHVNTTQDWSSENDILSFDNNYLSLKEKNI